MAYLLSHSLLIFSLFSTSIFTSISGFLVTKSISVKRPEKLSHFHFYFHDILGGKNPSAVQIITPPNPKLGMGLFGKTYVIDDPLTIGQDPKSKTIGKAQGLYSIVAINEPMVLMAMNFVFTEGKYNGSSLSILGRNPVLENVREISIVGGSGLFRFARGYCLAHTVFFNPANGDAIVEYNAYVLHY